MNRTLNPPQAEALMVAESCGRVVPKFRESEAQHKPTLAADSKTGAEEGDAAWLLLEIHASSPTPLNAGELLIFTA